MHRDTERVPRGVEIALRDQQEFAGWKFAEEHHRIAEESEGGVLNRVNRSLALGRARRRGSPGNRLTIDRLDQEVLTIYERFEFLGRLARSGEILVV